MPVIYPGLVSRLRLQEQITLGFQKPLTLITAPAGFGKTTLVASCLVGLDKPVAWISLDKNDNQAGRFLTYLVAALHELDGSIGSEAAQLLEGMQPAPPEAVLTSLVNDLETNPLELILVLDDYQFISSQIVHDQVAFLMDHCPAAFHLVITTRSDPPLPLSRLRARNQMVELRAADLSFSLLEATRFLNDVMQLDLDEDLVAVLEERTEGWIAGLQMAALSMQGRADLAGFIHAFAGTHRFIMDFMLEEVLVRESPEVQEFLLKTSILARLTGPLCDEVTEKQGGQEMLQMLEKRNLFVVSLDDDRRWYRYHHLFADLLQARLHQSGQAFTEQLYVHAALWSEQEGLINDAVEYALAAHDYQLVARLVVKYWQQSVRNGEIEILVSWLNAIPQQIFSDNPNLSITFCWVLWLTGQISRIETHLLNAEQAWEKLSAAGRMHEADPDDAQIPASLAVLRSFVVRYRSDFETAITLAKNALNLLPEKLPPDANDMLKSMIYLSLASAYDGAGYLDKAVDAYSETIRLSRFEGNVGGVTGITYRLVGLLQLLGRLRTAFAVCQDAFGYIKTRGFENIPVAGILHIALSELLLEWNDLETVQDHLSKGIGLGKWGGRLDAARNAAPALSRLRFVHHDIEGALSVVRDVERSLGENPSPLALSELLAVKSHILIRQGSLPEAAHCVEQSLQLAGHDNGQTGQMASLAAIRLLLAQQKPAQALARLAPAIAASQQSGRLGVLIQYYIFSCLAFIQLADFQSAETNLERALSLAEPQGYLRIFLDEGQPLRTVLAHWLAKNISTPLANYASRLLSQLDTELKTDTADRPGASPPDPADSANQLLIEPLSERELQVLGLMASGLSNKEIAGRLIVAAGTIKAHAASIYRKLECNNRTEAVSRARRLGILP